MSKRCSEPSPQEVSEGWIWELTATVAALCPSVFDTLSKPERNCIAERQQMHVGMHMRSRGAANTCNGRQRQAVTLVWGG